MLTAEQIQYLHKFCTKHYVRYHDVQVELVDHLAASVETEMMHDPCLDFEDAVNKVYKGFGITGFSKLVAAHERASGKRNNREFFQLFRSFFTPPRILFTIFLFLLLFLPFYFAGTQNNTVITGIMMAYAFLFLIAVSVHFRRFKKSHPAPVKSLITVDNVWSVDNSFFVIFVTQTIFVFEQTTGSSVLNSMPKILIFITFYVIMIISYLASARAYHTIYKTARKNYPVAFKN